jgi:hypothetical protein
VDIKEQLSRLENRAIELQKEQWHISQEKEISNLLLNLSLEVIMHYRFAMEE